MRIRRETEGKHGGAETREAPEDTDRRSTAGFHRLSSSPCRRSHSASRASHKPVAGETNDCPPLETGVSGGTAGADLANGVRRADRGRERGDRSGGSGAESPRAAGERQVRSSAYLERG